MVIKKSFLLILGSSLSAIWLLTGCPSTCVEAIYSFPVSASFTPELDSIRVGDTLYLVSFISTQLRDGPSGNIIDYQGAKIGGTLGIGKITPNSKSLIDAVDQFDYSSIQGKIYNSQSVPSYKGIQQIEYSQDIDSYKLKVGLIPRQEGIFVLGVGFPVGIRKAHDCEKAGFTGSVTNYNKHLYYWEKIFGTPLETSSSYNAYMFKVVPR